MLALDRPVRRLHSHIGAGPGGTGESAEGEVMGDIVNLKQRRKRKVRAEKEELAARNRVRFGRSKAERNRDGAIQSLEEKRIEAHKRDKDEL